MVIQSSEGLPTLADMLFIWVWDFLQTNLSEVLNNGVIKQGQL